MLNMTLRPFRSLVVAIAVLAFALPAASTAARVDPTTDRGVVQSVGSDQIVLRALDGSVVSFAVSSATRVKLNGVQVSLADIQPGFVASVVHGAARRPPSSAPSASRRRSPTAAS